MHKLAKHYGLSAREFTAPTLEACLDHSWPGNLEELQMFVKRYLVAGESEFPAGGSEPSHEDEADGRNEQMDFVRPPGAGAPGSSVTTSKSLKSLIQGIKCETERTAILDALGKTGWNRKAAARLLGVSYRTMLYKIEQYRMTASQSLASVFPDAASQYSDQPKGRRKVI